jgi:hypothetical protein
MPPARGVSFPHPEHAPVVPAVNPGIGLIKINMRSDLVFSGEDFTFGADLAGWGGAGGLPTG